MTAIEVLDDLTADLSEQVDDINCGGCGVMAAIFARELMNCHPELQIKFQKYGRDKHIETMRSEVLDRYDPECWRDVGLGWDHVWIELMIDGDWYALDSTGVHLRSAMAAMWGQPFPGSVELDELEAIVDEPEQWNSTFDRNQIGYMEQLVAEYLREYEEVAA